MTTIATMAFLLFVLVGTFFLTAATGAFRRLRRHRSKEELNELGDIFIYTRLHQLLFPDSEFEGLLFGLYSAQNVTRFLTGVTAVLLLLELGLMEGDELHTGISLLLALGLSLFLGDFLPRAWAANNPQKCVRDSAALSSLYLLIVIPITYPFLWWHNRTARTKREADSTESIQQVKGKIIEMIEGVAAESHLDEKDKRLIESAVTFRDRLVREVMVPRVDILALDASTSVREAAQVLDGEGYSRTPVYKESVDNIIGILMYKDLMNLFMRADSNKRDKSLLDDPIEGLIKPVLYTPETKKISDLLHEFRKKQTHIAVVVDEYGGTEGIVTIEDLLEEIVGEIEDEYDDEEALFTPHPTGGWVVDSRMTIVDLEEEVGFEVPQDADYDTIAGYILHRVGTIPTVGLVIHSDDFEMEILSCTDRTIGKVRITDLHTKTEENDKDSTRNDDST